MYRSYGIHALLNAVCEPEGVGAAVLIRALEPLDGIELMRVRRGLERLEGSVLGPRQAHAGARDRARAQRLRSRARAGRVLAHGRAAWRDVEVAVDTRIGITKAVELPWRFVAAGNRFVSRPGAGSGAEPPPGRR